MCANIFNFFFFKGSTLLFHSFGENAVHLSLSLQMDLKQRSWSGNTCPIALPEV